MDRPEHIPHLIPHRGRCYRKWVSLAVCKLVRFEHLKMNILFLIQLRWKEGLKLEMGAVMNFISTWHSRKCFLSCNLLHLQTLRFFTNGKYGQRISLIQMLPESVFSMWGLMWDNGPWKHEDWEWWPKKKTDQSD